LKYLKYLIVFIMCLTFTGCGASGTGTKVNTGIIGEYTYPDVKDSVVTLYYPSPDKAKVVSCTQTIPRTSQSFYMDIMTALLSNSSTGLTTAFTSGVECRSVMLVQNILYIDLSWRFSQMKPADIFSAISMMVSTFTQYSEIDFINLTVEGVQLTLPDMPLRPYMLFSAYAGMPGDFMNAYQAKLKLYQNDMPSMVDMCYVVIYSQDSSGSYLIPQATGVTVTGCDYASALLKALLAGTDTGTPIFTDGFTVQSNTAYIAEQKHLAVSLTCPAGWTAPKNWLAPQAIASTMASIYPDLESLTLSVYNGENRIYNATTDVSDVSTFIRSLINVYVPGATGTKLTKAKLLVSQMPNSMDLTDFTRDLLVASNNAFSAKDGLVNSVTIYGDMAVIDLGKTVYDTYQGISPEKEYAIVYSLVSSVCAYSEATCAMLLEDGQVRRYFTSTINVSSPLYSLPASYLSSLT